MAIVSIVLFALEMTIRVAYLTYEICTSDGKKHNDEQYRAYEQRQIDGNDLDSLLGALEPCPATNNSEAKATSAKNEPTFVPMEAVEYW